MGGARDSVDPRFLLWYHIDVDQSDEADPVKQCGPLALTELHILWEKGAIDRDTFVWADGMNDFRQVHQVPPLAAALVAAAADRGRTYPGGAVSAVTRQSSWTCRNADGEVSGPVTTATLKVWWDYEQIDEDSLVLTEGMGGYAPVCEVPPLFKALALGDKELTGANADAAADPGAEAAVSSQRLHRQQHQRQQHQHQDQHQEQSQQQHLQHKMPQQLQRRDVEETAMIDALRRGKEAGVMAEMDESLSAAEAAAERGAARSITMGSAARHGGGGGGGSGSPHQRWYGHDPHAAAGVSAADAAVAAAAAVKHIISGGRDGAPSASAADESVRHKVQQREQQREREDGAQGGIPRANSHRQPSHPPSTASAPYPSPALAPASMVTPTPSVAGSYYHRTPSVRWGDQPSPATPALQPLTVKHLDTTPAPTTAPVLSGPAAALASIMKQQPPPPPEQPQPQQQHHHHQLQKQQQQQARRHIDVSAGYSIEAAVSVSSGGASASQRSHLGGRFGSLYDPDPDPDPDPAAADEDEDEDEDDGVAHDNSRTLVFAGMTPDDIHRQRGGNGTNPHLLPGSPAAARTRSVDSTGIAGRQRAALASLPVPSPSRESHQSSVNSGSNNNGGGGGGSKRAMSEGGAGVIGQIGQMYGALQDEMQSLESEYVRLKAHLQDDYTRQYRGLETALAASEQRLTHTRARTRELQSTAHAERQALARERRDAEAVTESAGRAHAEAERAMAAAKSVGAREAAVSEREATIAAAGHELASRSASFERSRDDADRRWTELECQLTAERATLDSRRAELDTEYDKCVATKDALRAEGELAGQDLHRRSALVKETELRLDGDIRAFESARGEQQAQLDEHKCKVREQAEAGLWARPPRGGNGLDLEALERYREMNREMLETDREELRRERETVRATLGEERERMQRTRREESARAAETVAEMVAAASAKANAAAVDGGGGQHHHQLHRQDRSGGIDGGVDGARPSTSSPPHLRPGQRLHPQYPHHYQQPQQKPGYSSAYFGGASPAPASAAAAAAAGAVLVPVYRGGQPEEGGARVGDVALTRDTTVGALRSSLRAQFTLPAGFRLRRRRVPIAAGEDHRAALDFFRGAGDAVVVD